MAMTVKRNKDVRTKNFIEHRIADYRNGLALVAPSGSSFAGTIVPEGALVYPTGDGKATIISAVRVASQAASGQKNVKFAAGSCVKVGDVFSFGTIASLSYNADGSISATTTANLSGTLSAGAEYVTTDFATRINATVASNVITIDGQLAVNGTSQVVNANDNVFSDVWCVAVVKNPIWGSAVAGYEAALKGIVVIK